MLAFSLTSKSRKMNASCSVSSTGILVLKNIFIWRYLVSITEKGGIWEKLRHVSEFLQQKHTHTNNAFTGEDEHAPVSHRFWISYWRIVFELAGAVRVLGLNRKWIIGLDSLGTLLSPIPSSHQDIGGVISKMASLSQQETQSFCF